MTAKYGKTNWAQSTGTSNKINYSERYLKLLNGKNIVRLVTEPFQFMVHKVKFDGDQNKFGRSIKCALDDCPLCAKDNPAKERYVVALITRKTGELKYLEFGGLLYNKIKGITENMEGYADPTTYELNIVRNPSGGVANFYDAFPVGIPKPLTAEDMVLAESVDEEELEKLVSPLTPDEILASMKRISGWIAKNNNTPEVASEPVEETDAGSEVEDSDFSFKKNVR
jgi:hypothetical protein